MSSAGSKNTPQLTVLALLPNGDWRSSEIQHYLPAHDVPTDRGLIVKKLVAGLGYALVGKKPSLWTRHRWTGCEIAVEELGLMESTHQLLSTTYFRFVQKIDKPKPFPAQAPQQGGQGGPSSSAQPSSDAATVGQHVFSEFPDNLPPATGGNEDERGDQLPEGDTENFAQLNAKYRNKAHKWMASHPLDVMYLCRIVMEPLRLLMQNSSTLAQRSGNSKRGVKLPKAWTEGRLASLLVPTCSRWLHQVNSSWSIVIDWSCY